VRGRYVAGVYKDVVDDVFGVVCVFAIKNSQEIGVHPRKISLFLVLLFFFLMCVMRE
jgi:hypothetical protein